MIPTPRDITEVLRGVGGSEFPWKDPTLGTLLRRAADEIERLRAAGDSLARYMAMEHYPEDCEDECESLAAWRTWQEARRG